MGCINWKHHTTVNGLAARRRRREERRWTESSRLYIYMCMYLAVHVPSDDADAEHGVRGELAGSLHRNGLYPFVSPTLIVDRDHAIVEFE